MVEEYKRGDTVAKCLFGRNLESGERISFRWIRSPSQYREGDTILNGDGHTIRDEKEILLRGLNNLVQ